jgi:hypothetical protein
MSRKGSSNIHGYSEEKLARLAELSRASKAKCKAERAGLPVPTGTTKINITTPSTPFEKYMAAKAAEYLVIHPEHSLPARYLGKSKYDCMTMWEREQAELIKVYDILDRWVGWVENVTKAAVVTDVIEAAA